MKKITLSLLAVSLTIGMFAQNVHSSAPSHRDADRTATPSNTTIDGRPMDRQADHKDQPAAHQDSKPAPQKVKITPYGFVRNYINFDSRKTYTVVGGEYNMIPYDEDWNHNITDGSADVERYDKNASPHMQMQALTTRIGLNLDGPMVLGSKSSGKIEADFGGFGSNNYVFRIRQAYVKLSRPTAFGMEGGHSEILVGQTWHPLSGEIMPDVLGMAAGAPFRAHSRTPQIRTIVEKGHIGFTAALLWQLQYMNNGPSWNGSAWTSTNSIDFANNALWPEAFIGLNFKNKNIYAQLGVDAQVLKPRTYAMVTSATLGTTVAQKVDETCLSITPTIYFQYIENKFSLKFRTLLAENTSHVNQLNGYAVTKANADSSWEYAPLRATISYLNLAYGKTIKGNLFFGYMKNLGAAEDLHNFGSPAAPSYMIFLKGGNNFTHLNSVWRISPAISYNVKAFNIGLEYEITGATYGDIDKNGAIIDNDNLHQVVDHRICALIKYNF